MFVSKGQFLIFIACVGFGFASGSIFTFISPIKKVFSNRYLRALIDLLIFVIICFIFTFFANNLNFPNFRVYMPVGVLFGLLLYGESFHYILAKIGNIIYNILNNFFAKRRTKAKTIKGIKTNERN